MVSAHSKTRLSRAGALCLLLLCASACTRNTVETSALLDQETSTSAPLTDREMASLATKKVFFGHQSVGNNIIDGIRELAQADARLQALHIVKSADPQSVSGPAFVEFEIGKNGDPASKHKAFHEVIGKGMGAQGGIALFKYCFVDVDATTDVQGLFDEYRAEMSKLHEQYPALKVLHVTIPLTTIEPSRKAWVKSLLGRTTWQDLNVKRNQFNDLLRKTYSSDNSIFDLAEIESTRSDGSRSYFTWKGKKIYMLEPALTSDGGHLNEAGRRAAATALLHKLAEM